MTFRSSSTSSSSFSPDREAGPLDYLRFLLEFAGSALYALLRDGAESVTYVAELIHELLIRTGEDPYYQDPLDAL